MKYILAVLCVCVCVRSMVLLFDNEYVKHFILRFQMAPLQSSKITNNPWYRVFMICNLWLLSSMWPVS